MFHQHSYLSPSVCHHHWLIIDVCCKGAPGRLSNVGGDRHQRQGKGNYRHLCVRVCVCVCVCMRAREREIMCESERQDGKDAWIEVRRDRDRYSQRGEGWGDREHFTGEGKPCVLTTSALVLPRTLTDKLFINHIQQGLEIINTVRAPHTSSAPIRNWVRLSKLFQLHTHTVRYLSSVTNLGRNLSLTRLLL